MLNLTPLLRDLTIKTPQLGYRPLDLDFVNTDPKVGDVGDWGWAQRRMAREVERQYNEGRPVRLIVLKARQLGISTFSEACLFWWAFMHPGTNGLVLAHENKSSAELFEMTKLYWETFPYKEWFELKYQTKQMLHWLAPLRSRLQVATAKNLQGGRGFTIHALHASEVAFWQDAETLWTGLYQTVPETHGTIAIIESTANGRGGFFYDQWQKATEGEVDFQPLFFPWYEHPAYRTHTTLTVKSELSPDERELLRIGASMENVAWRRWAIANKVPSELDFMQEYPSCLVAGTRISTEEGWLPVEDIEPGTVTPYGVVLDTPTQPPARCVRVTTRCGLRLDCTWHHPLVLASGLLVTAEASLGQDLQLAVAPNTPEHPYVTKWGDNFLSNEIEWTDELALFVGYFMGDGYFSNANLSVCCDGKDADVVEEVVRLVKWLGVEPHMRRVGVNGGGTEIRASAKWLREPFNRLGLLRHRPSDGCWVREVRVPEAIWRSPHHHVRLFLAGLFEADGYSNKSQWDVRLFTRHEDFAHDIQLLLLNFGILATVVGEGTGWTVAMRGLQALAFHQSVGFRGLRKQGATPSSKPQNMRGRRLEVVSVEDIGVRPSYDLTIQDRPFYGAGGLLSHNTAEEAFLTSGQPLFSHIHLRKCFRPLPTAARGRLIDDPRSATGISFVSDPEGCLTIFLAPNRRASPDTYFAAVDPTETIDGDAACIQVINRITNEQVAVWHGHQNPRFIAYELMRLGKFYGECMVSSEIDGGGQVVIDTLVQHYSNIWRHKRPDAEPGRANRVFGWATTWARKRWAIGLMQSLVLDGSLIIHDRITYNQMLNFVNDDGYWGDRSRKSGRGDDAVMSLSIALVCSATEGPVTAGYNPTVYQSIYDQEYGSQAEFDESPPLPRSMLPGRVRVSNPYGAFDG